MMESHLNNLSLEVVLGDITRQPDCTAIVNAANAQLRTGGGVAGAIHRIGDPGLTKETREFAPIKPGEAVITSAPNFPNKYIIHCLGPVYGRDKPEDKILRNCYLNALQIADEHQIDSIAFPAISTGVFGYPAKDAAQVAMNTVKEISGQLKFVKRVRFVLWSEEDYEIHQSVLKKV